MVLKLNYIFLILLTIIIGFSPISAQNDDEVIKVDVALVNIPVIVSDKYGRNILGLNINNFTLFEDGRKQKIEYLSTQNTPLNIVLLLDTSRSALDVIENIKKAAGRFVKQIQPIDRCMIISFSEKVQVESEFTGKINRLEKSVENLKMSEKPGTLLNDAIYVTVDKELRKIKGRKAIILITDGKDAGSSTSQNDLIYRLMESDTPIYTIYYETSKFTFTNPNSVKNHPSKVSIEQQKPTIIQKQKNQQAAGFLTKVSETTAGRVFPKEINKLDEAFQNVMEELRKQYLIGYYPDDPNFDISRHQIKVKVDKPDVVVRTKNYPKLR